MRDPFRQTHRDLTADEMAAIAKLKDAASTLDAELVRLLGDGGRIGSREFALARTKLEECVMWAVKGITG